jgi:hypothetical protein
MSLSNPNMFVARIGTSGTSGTSRDFLKIFFSDFVLNCIEFDVINANTTPINIV